MLGLGAVGQMGDSRGRGGAASKTPPEDSGFHSGRQHAAWSSVPPRFTSTGTSECGLIWTWVFADVLS